MYCSNCGKEILAESTYCPHCGASVKPPKMNVPEGASDKEWLTTLLLCVLVGGFGIHSFYVDKKVIGIIQLCTLGACGIWVLVDLIMIATKNYKDAYGRPVVR